MRLVKWTSTLFVVTRLGMMMTHWMTTISKVVCGLQFDDVPPVAGHRWGTMGRMLSMRNPYIVLFNKLSTNLALVMGQSNCYR
jgi:hypothetical protein